MRVIFLSFLLIFSQAACYAATDAFTWDFGKVKAGEVVAHKFKLENRAKKVLEIKDVTASCGCTVAKIKQKSLLPGQNADVEVKFNSKGYSGAVAQHVYVYTDNTENPVIKFTVKAEVVK